jgi:hypothetical protein
MAKRFANRILFKSKSTVEGFSLQHLCTPSLVFFVISLIAFVLVGLGNLQNSDVLCIGDYTCNVGNNTILFVLNAIYILFWTFILDLMCKSGYTSFAWFVFLLPFIMTFILFAFLFVKSSA